MAGFGLLLMGGWLVVRALGVPLSGIVRLWPAIPLLTGLALVTQYGAERGKRGGLIFLGSIFLFSGIFLFAFTFEFWRLSWLDMIRYWPIFALIIGAAFLILFLAEDMRNESLLRPAYLIGGLGVFALPLTTGVIGGPMLNQAARFWPILLIPIVLLIVVQAVRSRNRNQPPG
jgi:hypothetical protein